MKRPKKSKPSPEYFTEQNAKLSNWRYMAFVVAKEFKTEPNKVLSEWESMEVLVTYGLLMNQVSFENWHAAEMRKPTYKEPKLLHKYAVPFKTFRMLVHERMKASKRT